MSGGLKTALRGVVDKLAGARSAVEQVRQAEAALRQEHEDLSQERSRLINAKPDRAQLLKALDVQVRALAEQWAADNGTRVVGALAGSLNVSPSGQVLGVIPGALADEFRGSLVDLGTLCALCPEAVRARLAAIIEKADYAAGPAMDGRPALVANLDKRMASVEQEHASLVDEAERAGVTLAHLDGERAKRIALQRRREAAALDNRVNARAIERGGLARTPEE
jgi:hypothetical protein